MKKKFFAWAPYRLRIRFLEAGFAWVPYRLRFRLLQDVFAWASYRLRIQLLAKAGFGDDKVPKQIQPAEAEIGDD